MGMFSRPRFVFVLPVPAALLIGACAEAPPPTSPPQNSTGAPGGVYQQQAGYSDQRGGLGQPGVASTAAAGGAQGPWSIPGLVEAAPRTVPDAVAQLERAEQILGFVLASSAGEAHPPLPSPGGSVSAAAERPVPLGDPCLIACAALASMKRSAEHVCSMSGEGDAMCGTARSRVQRAEQRVTAACPACSVAK